jgi:hypothetical protein
VNRVAEYVSERSWEVAINTLSKPTWSTRFDVSMTLKVRGGEVLPGA